MNIIDLLTINVLAQIAAALSGIALLLAIVLLGKPKSKSK